MLKLYLKFLLLIVLSTIVVKTIDSYCIQDELFHTTYNKFFSKKEKYDFVFMGNSLSQRTYNTRYIDSILNTKSINIGGSAHHFHITNAIFQEFINDEELHPNKVLVIEISPWQFKNYDTERLKFLQMAALDEIKYSKNYFNTINKFYNIYEYPKALSSTIRLHNELSENLVETNKKLKAMAKSNPNGFELNVTKSLKQELRNNRKDFAERASKYASGVDNSQEIPIDEEDERMILDIIRKCNEKNINLLFVTAPAINMIYNNAEFGQVKYIENLLIANKAKHINFNRVFNELKLTHDDYSDYSHVNKYGNQKVAPELLKRISNEFNITIPEVLVTEEPLIEDKKTETAQENTIIIENVSKWNRVNMDVVRVSNKYINKQDIYNISRKTGTQNAYTSTKGKIVDPNGKFTVSIYVKKGSSGDHFGFRLSGVYPNRVDAVFNLNKGTLKGVESNGFFNEEAATIEALDGDWFKCALTSKVNTETIKVILGPTDNNRAISTWEGATNAENDIYVVSNSLKLEEIIDNK